MDKNISYNTKLFVGIINKAKPFLEYHNFIDYIPSRLIENQAEYYDDIYDFLEDIERLITLTRSSNLRIDNDIHKTLISIKTYMQYQLSVISFQELIDKLYSVPIKYINSESIKNKINKIDNLLRLAGYKKRWPYNYIYWKAEDECDCSFFKQELNRNANIGLDYTFHIILPKILNKYKNLNYSRDIFKYSLTSINSDDKWQAYCSFSKNDGIAILLNSNSHFYKSQSYMIAFHELFPGHAFEILLREFLFDNGLLDAFYIIQLLGVPRTLIHEGLATYLPQYFNGLATLEQKIAILENSLFNDLRHNTGLDLFNGNISKDKAIEKLMMNGIRTEKEAKDSLDFCLNWPRYFLSYSSGADFVKKALETHTPWHDIYLYNTLDF